MFFVLFGAIAYGGLLFSTVALNGWPLSEIDQTAKVVKESKPGATGDRLFIPAINLNVSLQSLQTQGNPGQEGEMSIKGRELGFGLTPDALRTASPFFNLNRLKDGDEVFLDKNGVRYAYKITSSSKEDEGRALVLGNGKQTKKAEIIGTVAWKNGSSELEAL